MTKSKHKITDEALTNAVKTATTFSDALRSLGFTPTGNIHTYYKRRAIALNLDMSHFNYDASLSSRAYRTADSILILRPEGDLRTQSVLLRRALIQSGVPYCCSKCGQDDTWMTHPLTLDVDHINQNWLDNRKENLRFLCPNCHSQFSRHLIIPTPPRPSLSKRSGKKCKICDNITWAKKNKYCSPDCARVDKQCQDWSSIDLISLVDNDKKSYSEISRLYNVSSTTIKRWYLIQKQKSINE